MATVRRQQAIETFRPIDLDAGKKLTSGFGLVKVEGRMVGNVISPTAWDPTNNGRGEDLPLPVCRRTDAGRGPRKVSDGQHSDEPFGQGGRAGTRIENSKPGVPKILGMSQRDAST